MPDIDRAHHPRRPGGVPPAVFRAEQRILAIVGDVTADEAMAAAERCSATGRGARAGADAAEPPKPTRRIVVVDKPDAVQTEVRIGQHRDSAQDPDYMAVNLAIRILGGEGGNRLYRVLRTDRGLTYGAPADIDTFKAAATSRPKPTRGPRPPAKCCG